MHLSLFIREGNRAEHTEIKICAAKSTYVSTLPFSKKKLYSLDIVQNLLELVQNLLKLIYFLSAKSVEENSKINLNVNDNYVF